MNELHPLLFCLLFFSLCSRRKGILLEEFVCMFLRYFAIHFLLLPFLLLWSPPAPLSCGRRWHDTFRRRDNPFIQV